MGAQGTTTLAHGVQSTASQALPEHITTLACGKHSLCACTAAKVCCGEEGKWSLPQNHTTLSLILPKFVLKISSRKCVPQVQAAGSCTGHEVSWVLSTDQKGGLV